MGVADKEAGDGRERGKATALKYTPSIQTLSKHFNFPYLHFVHLKQQDDYFYSLICLHTDVTMYEPRSPPAPPLPPPSPPFGSRFLVTGVGMSEGRVGVVDVEEDGVVVVVLVAVAAALTSALLFLGLGV